MSDLKPAEKPAKGNAAPAKKATTGAYTPSGVSPNRRARRSYTIRLWAVRHSRFLEWFYHRFADAFLLLHPLWIRQRIQNCNWRRYQKKILIARIGMIVIVVSTAIAAVYLESRNWQKTAVIAGLIACYILMRCEQSRRKKKH